MSNNNLNVAIIGAGGSIGSEFIKQLCQRPEVTTIYAFSSSKPNFNNPKVQSHHINITDEESIKECAAKTSNLALTVVATGMLHDQNIQPEKSLRELSAEKFQQLFAINTIAPAIIIKHFTPRLSKDKKSTFAAISARVGSISDNHLGGWYAYRASKAALNMIIKNTSIEMSRTNKNTIIIGLHPGTVNSQLSKPFQNAVLKDKLFTPQYCVEELLKVIDNLNASDSGNILDFNGLKIEF